MFKCSGYHHEQAPSQEAAEGHSGAKGRKSGIVSTSCQKAEEVTHEDCLHFSSSFLVSLRGSKDLFDGRVDRVAMQVNSKSSQHLLESRLCKVFIASHLLYIFGVLVVRLYSKDLMNLSTSIRHMLISMFALF